MSKRGRRQDLVPAIISTNSRKEPSSGRRTTPKTSADSVGGKPTENNGLYADTTMGALRTNVEACLGVALDGKNRFHFDKALLTLTNTPEKRPRAHRRFKMSGLKSPGKPLCRFF